MKTRLTTLLTALMLISIVSFANDGFKPSKQLQKEFSQEFAQAADVNWEKVGDYFKASFIENGKYFVAYFNVYNQVQSISRNISTDMLPLVLQKNLKDKTSERTWITGCIELLGENGTEYYIVVENAFENTIYQSNGTSWEEYKRTDK
jgi:hypothetical protein